MTLRYFSFGLRGLIEELDKVWEEDEDCDL